ncbi:autotransporter assembly complex protein TamB [Pseudoalteromonas sp. T1lg23B]|uniref:autotransporter assembly complex protein TamB n=1 Tax=Pseudoalteromonas sp. T1lg23B TaxID=2077097 RepID=UPI000CF6796A|nr:translocation/assembly module TamB domain-containing protein [Pseudoalteromonas sp. T1lg23B]
MSFMSRFKKILGGFAAIGVVIFCIIATAPGHQLLVGIANYTVPDLKVELADGRLLSGTPINVDYNSEQLVFNAQALSVSLEWFSCATLCLDISAQQLKVAASSSTQAATEPSSATTSISLPLSLGVNEFNVAHIDVALDQQQISIEKLQSAIQWQDSHINVSKLLVDRISLNLPEAAEDKSQTIPTSLAGLALPPVFVPLDVRLADLKVGEIQILQGEKTTVIDELVLQGAVTSQQLKWHTLAVKAMDITVDSQGTINWSDAWQLQVNLLLDKGDNQLQIDAFGPLSELQLALKSRGTYPSELQGQIDLTSQNWPFYMQFDAHSWDLGGLLQAPLQQLQLQQASINLVGDVNDYSAQLAVEGSTSPEAPIEFTTKFHGTLTGLTIDTAQLKWAESVATLVAQLSWQQGIMGKIETQLSPLPMQMLLPDYANTELSANLTADFNLDGEQWQFDIDALEVSGQLLGKDLSAHAQLKLDQHLQGQLNALTLRYGQSKLLMSGTLGQQLALSGEIDVNHQHDAIIPVDLVSTGSLVISGTHSEPQVEAHVDIQQFGVDSLIVKNVQLDLQTNSAANWATNAQLNANYIQYGASQLNNVRVALQGDMSQHKITIDTVGDLEASLTAKGSWLNQQWQGELSDAILQYQQQTLTLLESANIKVSKRFANVDKHCWQLVNSKVCIGAQQNIVSGAGSAVADVQQLILEDANHWLANKARLDGFAHGGLSVAWQDGQLTKVDGQLQMQQLKVHSQQDGQTHTLPVENLQTQLTSSNQLAKLDWQVNSSILGRLQGLLEFPLLAKNTDSVRATVEIVHMSLSPLAPILSKNLQQPVKLSGNISGELSLSGDVRTPEVVGEINIEDIALASPVSPISLVSSTLGIKLAGKQGYLSGQLQGEQGGNLTLDGAMAWKNELTARITAKGQDFLLSPETNIELTISPDLTVEYANNQASVVGKLLVPYGRIEIKDIPAEAIQVSDDQIIVDAKKERVSRSPIAYSIDVDVLVGDDFRIKALGLDSYITGHLDVTKVPARALLASGELSLLEGRYRAFGQDLLIKTGQIGFNGALDKPYLNVRAIRNPEVTADGVEAGIELSGSISTPRFSIYSQPAMDQSQALAYLLNGEPLGEGESSNNAILTQLLLSQGLNRSENLVAKTGEKLGFSDVSLGARGSGESTKVEVSGYLTPSVQVSYRVGVFDSLSEIAVRYRVFSKLYIEATSGLYDSIDLLYKFDLD